MAEIIIIPIAIISARFLSSDDFIRRMYTYGLAFSNFGFMGNAVVGALFPGEFYQSYIIFTLPLWMLIYIWGVPCLLIERRDISPKENLKIRLSESFKSLLNPMFIALLIGVVVGATGMGEFLLSLNDGRGIFITQVVKVLGDCMSPIAMTMTGITFAFIDIKKVLANMSIYFVTLLRLVVYPLVFGGIALLIKNHIVDFDITVLNCLVISTAMPLGLNTIVIPSAYGRDTSVPAGMALISHLLSIITIPFIMTVFEIG